LLLSSRIAPVSTEPNPGDELKEPQVTVEMWKPLIGEGRQLDKEGNDVKGTS
jgi:hypothetical protein